MAKSTTLLVFKHHLQLIQHHCWIKNLNTQIYFHEDLAETCEVIQ